MYAVYIKHTSKGTMNIGLGVCHMDCTKLGMFVDP
jgi:hypothetical protein